MRAFIAAVLVLAVTAPTALASTRAQRITAAKTFVRRTVGLERQVFAAGKRADAAREARRAAAQSCAAVFQGAPASAREDLRDLYFWYLGGGLWSVDRRLYGSWIADLRRSRRIDRAPALARAADALRDDYRGVDFVFRAFPDACAAVTAWRDAGWTAGASPVGTLAFPRYDERRHERVMIEATRQIRRYAHTQLSLAIDEVDARVHATKGCDPIGKLLFPDDYEC